MEEDEAEDAEGGAETEKGRKGNRIRPRERYRVLIDILDEMQVLIAIGDRKARFALMILAAFNAAVIIGGTMSYRFSLALPPGLRVAGLLCFGVYGLTAIYFFLLAIDALRPRKAPVAAAGLTAGTRDSAGTRFFMDIIKHRREDYWEAVRGLDYERLNRELAFQAHGLAALISAKYDALEHLYSGMRILTVGAAVLLAVAAGSATAAFLFD